MKREELGPVQHGGELYGERKNTLPQRPLRYVSQTRALVPCRNDDRDYFDRIWKPRCTVRVVSANDYHFAPSIVKVRDGVELTKDSYACCIGPCHYNGKPFRGSVFPENEKASFTENE